ncbi:MAG TPA: CSLREA domain-containing protein, partial [Anaerolineales bacterium]
MNTKYIRHLLLRYLLVCTILLFALSPFGGALAEGPTTYVVNTVYDVDDGVCNKAHCSLREAINLANVHPGADTIEFKIRGGPPFTIQPSSALPEITDPVTIDGTTQPGFHGNPIVELDGSNAGEGEPEVGISGLVITAGSSTVKGLVINRFSGEGILMTTNGGNTIQGNFVGTDVTGMLALSNTLRGIHVAGGSSGNIISGNLISGNARAGVLLTDTEGNQVQGNFIGTDINGTSPLANDVGVKIMGAAKNVIGGTEAGARNLISGNAFYGVFIATEGTTGNIVQGNYIGTDVTGSIATIPAGPPVGEYTLTVMPETCPTYDAETDFDGFVSESNDPSAPWSGTSVHFFGSDVCIGREMLGGASLIYRYKLEFAELTQLTSIAVSGANFNGPDNVLRVLDEHMNVLGIAPTFGQNEWSTTYIDLQGIEGTIFYIDEFDTSTTWRYRQSITINEPIPLGNLADGVFIAASDNLIAGNLISGNMWFGVEILDPDATGNTLQGNFIGTDASGSTALPNAYDGILIGLGASDNLIGGVDEGEGNVISGNGGD